MIPDKLYFKIGEVSELAGLPSHVLRFWETEFAAIRPKRTATGQRLYTPADVKRILEIKHLLYDKKFTIAGARQHLKSKSAGQRRIDSKRLRELRRELQEIRDLLG
jgi:DNA-binding transcriptional MerR regulator